LSSRVGPYGLYNMVINAIIPLLVRNDDRERSYDTATGAGQETENSQEHAIPVHVD